MTAVVSYAMNAYITRDISPGPSCWWHYLFIFYSPIMIDLLDAQGKAHKTVTTVQYLWGNVNIRLYYIL